MSRSHRDAHTTDVPHVPPLGPVVRFLAEMGRAMGPWVFLTSHDPTLALRMERERQQQEAASDPRRQERHIGIEHSGGSLRRWGITS